MEWLVLILLAIIGLPILHKVLVLFDIASDAEYDIEADKPDE